MKSQYYAALSCCIKINFRSITCFWLSIFIVSWSQNTFGQCNSPGSLPSLFCEDAPLACLEGSCFETTNTPLFCCNGWCGPNTAIHNPQYFAFIASDENVEILIHVDYCDSGGNALQSALLDACPWENFNVLDCDPGTGAGGTMVLSASGLIPDEIYWIVVDGNNGSICGYTFTETSGIYEGFSLMDILPEETFVSDTMVCAGYDNLFFQTGPEDPFAHGYYWVPSWSADTITSTLPYLNLDIPGDLPPGSWEVCVSSFSGCDTSNTICIPFHVFTTAPVTKGPDIFCQESFPFVWGNEVIPGPGSYLQSFLTPEGCSFDTLWIIESYPEADPGIIDTTICASTFLFEGIEYVESGTYALFYPGASQYGCDSTLELTVRLAGFEAYVEIQCQHDSATLLPIITEQASPQDSIQYAWYDCNYSTLYSTASEFAPDSSGCYCLIMDNGICSDTICSGYSIEPCLSLCDVVPDFACNNADLQFAYPETVQESDSIFWRIVQPDQSDIILTGEDTFTMSFTMEGFYLVSVTTQNDSTTETCLDIFEILPNAEVGICCDTLICDSCTILSVYSSDGPVTITLLATPGGTWILDGLLFAYEFEVCPPPLTESTFTIVDAVLTGTTCPATITNANSASVFRAAPLQASIVPQGEMLCALPEDMTGYAWRACEGGNVLDFSRCFTPDTSGCYCVSIISPDGCRDTVCYEFIIDAIEPVPDGAGISIVPNPSKGEWNISLPQDIVLPVNWSLTDVQGKQLQKGVFTSHEGSVILGQQHAHGVYLLHLDNPAGLTKILKVVLQ